MAREHTDMFFSNRHAREAAQGLTSLLTLLNEAKADLQFAQAEAEMRRAAAVALEQEMKAAVEANRAKVVLAEAEVPLALAYAFRAGHLGVMDYFNGRNPQPDIEERNGSAGTGTTSGTVMNTARSDQS